MHLLQLITQLFLPTSGLELQEFEEILELVGIRIMAFVLEMVNDSGHYTKGEVVKLIPIA